MKLPLTLAVAVAGVAASLAIGGGSANAQSSTNNSQPAKPAQQVQPKADPEVVINPGDSLSSIATANSTTYVRLYDANIYIQDPDLIYPGDKVKIPAADEQLADRGLSQNTGSPAVSESSAVSHVAAVAAPSSAPVAGCGDNAYANFIYSHESGCRTTAMSPNGCYGIGQACPASKLAYCGADYACQNAFFTAYAGKYGGWAGAYAFWVAHGWW